MPKLALAPLFILWFGIGVSAKIVFVASIVFFLHVLQRPRGDHERRSELIAMLRVAGASEWFVSREIVWNTAKPFLFAGLKIALPRALSGAVVGEFIAADSGLGWYIQNTRSLNDTTGVLAGAVIVTRAGDRRQRGAEARSSALARVAAGRSRYDYVKPIRARAPARRARRDRAPRVEKSSRTVGAGRRTAGARFDHEAKTGRNEGVLIVRRLSRQ